MKEELLKLATEDLYVIDPSFSKSSYVPINLSFDNPELENVDVSSSKKLGEFVDQSIVKQNGKVGYGGYLEQRKIYERSEEFNDDERNIHIGLDLWAAAGTSVHALMDGEIHSFQNNAAEANYGPTIILKHSFEGLTFYTLYGHLSLESLDNKAIGQKVSGGETVAWLGDVAVNGDYPPHLHFQLILDVGDYRGDYPGVCSLIELDYYKLNCPNPEVLFNL